VSEGDLDFSGVSGYFFAFYFDRSDLLAVGEAVAKGVQLVFAGADGLFEFFGELGRDRGAVAFDGIVVDLLVNMRIFSTV
jgi:hypothetical protein